jgi:hypothetical protein
MNPVTAFGPSAFALPSGAKKARGRSILSQPIYATRIPSTVRLRLGIQKRNEIHFDAILPSPPRGSRTTLQRCSTVKLKANKIEPSAAR